MTYFHKSHVSVFVARGTLTRGRSPNTECIKPPGNTPDTQRQTDSTATSINAERRSENFVQWRQGNILSSEEYWWKKTCVCVFEVCLYPPLSQDRPHIEQREGQWVQLDLCFRLLCSVCTHTCTQVLWGKSSRTPWARVRVAVVVSMETAT